MAVNKILPFFYKNSRSHIILNDALIGCICIIIGLTAIKLFDCSQKISIVIDIFVNVSLSYVAGYIFYMLTIFYDQSINEDKYIKSFSALYSFINSISDNIKSCSNDKYKIDYEAARWYCNSIIEIIGALEMLNISSLNFKGIIIRTKKSVNTMKEDVEQKGDKFIVDLQKLTVFMNDIINNFPDHNEIVNRIEAHLNNDYAPKDLPPILIPASSLSNSAT